DVVGDVAEERQGPPGGAAAPLPHGEQVGQQLAGVEPVGEGVDHRDGGGGGHLGEPVVAEGTHDDRLDVPGQHRGGVGQRLAAAEVGHLRVDDDRMPTELGDRDVEGDPGAQRRLVEQDRHRTGSGQRAVRERVALHRLGEVQHPRLFVRAQVVVAQQMTGHAGTSAAARSRAAGRAARNASACAWLRISGGARRTTSGRAALTRKPASRSAATVADAAGAVSTIPSSRPAPRTSATSRSPRSSTPCRSRSPTRLTWSSSPSAALVRSTASAAAHATGLPPNVLPWLPGGSREAGSPPPGAVSVKTTQAPSGRPPPSPLASVTTSGVTPSAWGADRWPVRPTPVCTSSSTSRAPCLRVISRAEVRYPAGGTTTPASPWMGSRITMAVRSS